MEHELPPAFLKVYLSWRSSRRLKLPYTEVIYPENVTVTGKSGNSWNLKMEKPGKSYYFTEGWVEFVAENSLCDGDLLVFYYVREENFTVNILGLNGCEKNLGTAPDLNACECVNNQVISPDLKASECEKHQGMFHDPNACEHNQGMILDLNASMNAQDIENNIGTEDHNELEVEEEVEAPATQMRRRRKRVPDQYGLDLFSAGLADRPQNPYFVTSIGITRKYELYIPMDMVKRVQFELPRVTRLVDPLGRKFEVKRTVWKNGKIHYIGGGWGELCRENNVDPKDRCIVEFVPVQANNDEPEIHVTIVRASELERLNLINII